VEQIGDMSFQRGMSYCCFGCAGFNLVAGLLTYFLLRLYAPGALAIDTYRSVDTSDEPVKNGNITESALLPYNPELKDTIPPLCDLYIKKDEPMACEDVFAGIKVDFSCDSDKIDPCSPGPVKNLKKVCASYEYQPDLVVVAQFDGELGKDRDSLSGSTIIVGNYTWESPAPLYAKFTFWAEVLGTSLNYLLTVFLILGLVDVACCSGCGCCFKRSADQEDANAVAAQGVAMVQAPYGAATYQS